MNIPPTLSILQALTGAAATPRPVAPAATQTRPAAPAASLTATATQSATAAPAERALATPPTTQVAPTANGQRPLPRGSLVNLVV